MDRTGFLEYCSERRNLFQTIAGILFVAIIIGCFYIPQVYGYLLLVCLVLAMAIGPFLGRYWCSWMCPRGSFFERIWKRLSFRKRLSGLFRNIYFQILIILIFMAMMILNYVNFSPNMSVADALGATFARVFIVSTIVGVVLAIFYNPRAWCTFCPGGTFAKVAALYRSKTPSVNIDSSLCTECRTCSTVCPLEIDCSKYRDSIIMTDADCLKCLQCINACPSKALSLIGQGGDIRSKSF